MSTEAWKTVTDYPDYEVSDQGQIRSLKRATPRNLKQNPRQDPDKRPYLAVCLYGRGRKSTEYVHLWVAHEFLGAMPSEHYCAHLDGDTTNNHIDNLAYLPDEYQGLLR